ncbi:hypothetical protein Tco_0545456 [Tanacetum coccineum]
MNGRISLPSYGEENRKSFLRFCQMDINTETFSNSEIEFLLFNSNYYIDNVKKRSSYDKGKFIVFFHFENNEIGREGEFTNFNEHIFSLLQQDIGIGTIDCDHGSFCAFPSYEAKHRSVLILPSNWFPLARVKWLPLMANSFAVSGMVIVEPGVGANIRQLLVVEVDCFFVRMLLFCFVDEVFDSESFKFSMLSRLVCVIDERIGNEFDEEIIDNGMRGYVEEMMRR